jgi:GNAT superfamily N-acetyltransferase
MTATAPAVRSATEADVPAIHALIRDLAEFEQLAHLCCATEADLRHALFGPSPAAEVLIAACDGEVAGFALFFHNFSTFVGRRGLWLEDLYVRPVFRRRGCAQALLRRLAGIAGERGCGRFEWAVLDWNADAIRFYEALGGTVLPDWRIVRVTGPALAAMASDDASAGDPTG